MFMTFIVPVSGGKDSQVCLAWAVEHHDRKDLRVVHQFTGYDHPKTLRHMEYMSRRYRVTIEHTVSSKYKDVFDFIEKAGYFPSQVARGCTSRLKQEPFARWLESEGLMNAHVYMGMRSDESAKRANKYGELAPEDIFTLPEISSEYPAKFSSVTVSLPIVTWTTEEVFAYLAARHDKINPLYQQGHHRVGCYPCLLARNSEWEAAAKDPVGRQHIKKLLDIEEMFVRDKNPRKLIKIHPTRDVRGLYERSAPLAPSDDAECGWCSI